MDIEEIHVGMKYYTANGLAVVTGINRDDNTVQLDSLEQTTLGLPLPGVNCSVAFDLPAESVYEELIE